MTVISSQRFLDNAIVDIKKEKIKNEKNIELNVIFTGIDDLYILVDGHHTLAAAKELNILVDYNIVADDEELIEDDLLEKHFMDSDWYNIDTDNLVF